MLTMGQWCNIEQRNLVDMAAIWHTPSHQQQTLCHDDVDLLACIHIRSCTRY